MSFTKLLNKTCVIQQKAETQTGIGELTLTWSTKASGVKTRYLQAKQAELRGAFQVTSEDYKFFFEFATDISIADRIVVDGQTYEVKHVLSDSSAHHKFAYAEIVKFT